MGAGSAKAEVKAVGEIVKRPNWIVRALYFLQYVLCLKWGLYYLWSRVYRRLHENAYKGSVPTGSTLAVLQRRMQRFDWERDGLKTLGDAIGYPRHLEETGKGDCDEFAAWWCDAGRDGFKDSSGREWEPVGILTVTGAQHNVAIFAHVEMTDRVHSMEQNDGYLVPTVSMVFRGIDYAHVSNWFGGCLFDGLRSVNEIAWDVANRSGALPMAYCLVSPDLKRRLAHGWIGGKRG